MVKKRKKFSQPIDKIKNMLYYCISTVIQGVRNVAWQFNGREAVFVQIADKLRNDILLGVYSKGQQFPSVRALAEDAGVNPNTMQKALGVLENEGLLSAHGTVGRFVTEDEALIQNAAEKMRRKTVRVWIAQASAIGISTEELISYIKEDMTDKSKGDQ